MSTNRRTPASWAAATRSRVPCFITAVERLRLAGDDRDEMDDGVDALDRAAQARRVGEVALHGLGGPQPRPGRAARLALEHADGVPGFAERAHDCRPHETRPAGDEHVHDSKFFQ